MINHMRNYSLGIPIGNFGTDLKLSIGGESEFRVSPEVGVLA